MDVTPELIATLVDALKPAIEAVVAAATANLRAPATTPQVTTSPAIVDTPLSIPRPPNTPSTHKSTATCKQPKEPALDGDKAKQWTEFEQEFLRYFRITQSYYLEPEVQVDLLLALAGEKVRKTFFQLKLPADEAKNLEKSILALRKVYAQQQSPFVNSYLFMKIKREPGEDLDGFVTRLRDAARQCAFEDEDKRVLEQLVFSTIDHVDVLKRIIKESPPSLEEMIRILKADEVAKMEMDRMVGSDASVHAVNNRRFQKPAPSRPSQDRRHRTTEERVGSEKSAECPNCVFRHEKHDECPAKTMECFYCLRKGHMIRKCRKRQNSNRYTEQRPEKRKTVHEIESLSEYDDSDNEVAIDKVFVASLDYDDKENSWQTPIRIAGKLVNCKIDTGAEVNVMPRRVFKQLRDKPSLKTTATVLHTVAGQTKPLGVITVPVQHKEKKTSATFYVIEDSTKTLCGLQTSVELGLVQKLFQ